MRGRPATVEVAGSSGPVDAEEIHRQVFALDVGGGRYLVYAPLKGMAFVANGSMLNLLQSCISPPVAPAVSRPPSSPEPDSKIVKCKYTDEQGQMVQEVLPCGSDIPSGAICTCNCVPGTLNSAREVRTTSCQCHSVLTCSCDKICTCNKICTCVPVSY